MAEGAAIHNSFFDTCIVDCQRPKLKAKTKLYAGLYLTLPDLNEYTYSTDYTEGESINRR